MTIAVLP